MDSISKMADDQRRRRVRDISESSETELNPTENSVTNLTQCDSEVGTLSQSVTAVSELDDTGDLEDVSDGESEETTDAEEEAGYAAEDAEHGTISGDCKTEGEESEIEGEVLKKNNESVESGECTATDETGSNEDEEEVWKNERRHSGDGEEQKEAAGEKCDIDEDRANPAFIPRKGMFYEHDMRLGDENEKEVETTKNKKKLWSESHKWDHDRYDPGSQAPKSRGEIIGIYGYDIRLDDTPPKYVPSRSRGNRRQRGSRKLGDFIHQGDHSDSDHNDDSDIHSRSGHIPSRSQNRRSSDNRSYSGDDSTSNTGREPRQSGRGGRASRANRGNRGRYSDMRQQRGPRLDSDRVSSASSNDESSYQEERHGRREVDSRDVPNRRGAVDRRMDNGRVRGYHQNKKNWQNERQRGSGSMINQVQPNAESRDDEEIARYSENMYAKSRGGADNGHDSRRARDYKNERSTQNWEHRKQQPDSSSGAKEHIQAHFESVESKRDIHARSSNEHGKKLLPFTGGVRDQKPNYRSTRIISSSHYKHADSTSVRDRNSQIQGVVSSMEKLSLGKSVSSEAFVGDISSGVHSGPSGSWKTNRAMNSSDVDSDTIPPVTRHYTRTVQAAAADAISAHLPSSREHYGSSQEAMSRPPMIPSQAGYEMAFRPVSRTTAAAPQLTQQQLSMQASKPKRYSTQRQRGQAEAEDSLDMQELVPEPPNVPPSHVGGNSLPPRLLRSKYQDEEMLRQHMLQYPSRSVISTRTPASGNSVPYSGTGAPPSHYYSPPEVQTQAADSSPTTMMHPASYLAPRHIIPSAPTPGQYYPQQPMYNYVPVQAAYIPTPQSHYRMPPPAPNQMRPYIAPTPNPQMMSEVSPSMEVRGGTVYFNAETQQPELRVGGIYYGPAGQQGGGTVMQAHRPSSAIPIVNPQEAGGRDGYYAEAGEYAPYEHYISSPVPYDAAAPMLMATDGTVDGAYA